MSGGEFSALAAMTPTVKRCPETRAHYAHEFYTPLRTYCPGGPDENIPSADACMWCGRDPASGLASINDKRYCHGDDDPGPTCYQSAQWCLSDATTPPGEPR